MSCYSPNGTLITDTSFAPCNTDGNPSMCCAINKPDADLCLSNGVCRWIDAGVVKYFRNSCSDENWDSPFCLSQCTGSGQTLGGEANNARLSLCPDGSWCCGDDAENGCCGTGNTFVLAATIGISSSTSTSASASSTTASSSSSLISSTATSAAASSTLSSATPSATSSPSSGDSGLSTGAQAGIGVGVALGVLAVVGVLAGLYWRKRKQARAGAGYAGYPPAELDSSTRPMSEMPSPPPKEVYAKVAPETPRAELA